MVFIRSISSQLRRPASSLLSSSGFSFRPGIRPGSLPGARTLTASASRQGKVLMVLYEVCQIWNLVCKIALSRYNVKSSLLYYSNVSCMRFILTHHRAGNMPKSSRVFSVPSRMNLAWESGLRSKVTSSSLPPTRTIRTLPLTRSWLTLKSSSPRRKSVAVFSFALSI